MSVPELVERMCGPRHGPLAWPAVLPATASDPSGIVHASSSREDGSGRSAGGGAARSVEAAMGAAVGESIERMVASYADVPVRRAGAVGATRHVRIADCALHSPAQRAAITFPHAAAYLDDEPLAEVFDLATNEPMWIPAALVALTDEHGALATSSGLAASPSVVTALLRGLQEVVERDAFMATWLHQLGGREVPAPALAAELAPLGATVQAFDLTPAFSPHPVALVAASIPHRGAPRPSIGLACRATWDDAVEKAFLECCQGTVFVGHTLTTRPALRTLAPTDVVGFDEHAVYYGANPDRWDEIPLRRFAAPAVAPPPSPASGSGHGDQLVELVAALQSAGTSPCYRELTTVDAAQLRVRVVRVVVPELTPLHHDHRWPFLGGRTADVTWRYPDAPDRSGGRPFPSPHPHALG